jgi:hypothetical protein
MKSTSFYQYTKKRRSFSCLPHKYTARNIGMFYHLGNPTVFKFGCYIITRRLREMGDKSIKTITVCKKLRYLAGNTYRKFVHRLPITIRYSVYVR